ncbi:hypothetical protein FLLO111716_01050 [Flavobacterium longum]|uniref:hypothetical protein n=1 Tax=Flavobacterium longum TaxID=1299340 RepID=UPI0039E8130B
METKNLLFANLMDNDIVDIRDIIEQFEETETDFVNRFNEQHEPNDAIAESDNDLFKAWLSEISNDDEEAADFELILSLLENLKGYGGDEQWRGDWYPITLIRDDYFEDYAQQLAEDIGAVDRNAAWPNNCIDWKQAAKELEMDYSTIDFKKASYLYR